MGIILACCIFLQTGENVSPFLSTSLNRSFGCLSPLAVKLERRPFEPSSYTLSWQRDLLCYFPHIFSRNVAHSGASPYTKSPESYVDSHARAMLSRYQSATRKLFVYDLLHTQFPLFSNTLLCSRNFCELVILCVMLLCPNNLVHCYRNVRETQWTPNKPKTRRL